MNTEAREVYGSKEVKGVGRAYIELFFFSLSFMYSKSSVCFHLAVNSACVASVCCHKTRQVHVASLTLTWTVNERGVNTSHVAILKHKPSLWHRTPNQAQEKVKLLYGFYCSNSGRKPKLTVNKKSITNRQYNTYIQLISLRV